MQMGGAHWPLGVHINGGGIGGSIAPLLFFGRGLNFSYVIF
jgi:hypothetical protein